MFKNYEIIPIKNLTNLAVRYFLIKNHYKKQSLPRACFKHFVLVSNNEIKGLASYGTPCSPKFNKGKVLELKRFVLSPDCPKNTGSWFMSKCHKELKKQFNKIITYADPQQGHEGTLYKASNFQFMGVQKKKGQAIKWKNKKYHLRQSYQKRNGKYTKFAINIQDALKKKEAKYVTLKPKLIFSYNLKGR